MKQISRSELSDQCPRCQSDLMSYHQEGITRKVCAKKCNGFEVIAEINHRVEALGLPDGIKLMENKQ